jgi:hypothetical protein
VSPVEEYALGGEVIEVGRQVLWLPSIDSERLGMEIIRGEEQDVGSLVLDPEGQTLEGERGGQQEGEYFHGKGVVSKSTKRYLKGR